MKIHVLYRQSPTLKTLQHEKTTIIKQNRELPKETKNAQVTNTYDSNLDKHAHINGTKNANRHITSHTKPTSQPIKMVGTYPAVAAGRPPAIKPTHADSLVSLSPATTIQIEHNNNNYTTPHPEHILEQETQQKTA
jgi:hypothetical protein